MISKSTRKRIRKAPFWILSSLVLKNKHQICINSFPDYDDSALAISREVLASAPPEFKVVFLTELPPNPPAWAMNSRFTKRLLSHFGIVSQTQKEALVAKTRTLAVSEKRAA